MLLSSRIIERKILKKNLDFFELIKVTSRVCILSTLFLLSSCSKNEESDIRKLAGKIDQELELEVSRDGVTFDLDLNDDKTKDGISYDRKKLDLLRRMISEVELKSGFEVAEADLAKYGLDKPRLSVAFISDEHNNLELDFGNYSNYAGKRYSRVKSEQKVYLVPEDFFQNLDKDQTFFLDTTLVEIPEEVCELLIHTPERDYLLTKQGSDWYQVSGKVRLTADSGVIESILKSLTFLRSKQLVEGAKGFDQNGYKFRVSSCNDEVVEVNLSDVRKDAFDITGPDIKLSVNSNSDVVYSIKRTEAPVLIPEGISFRKQNPTEVDVDSIRKANFDKGVESRKILLEGSNWKVNDKPGDAPFIRDIFKSINGLDANGYVSENLTEELVNSDPMFDISLYGESDELLLSMAIWSDSTGKKFYAWNKKHKELFPMSVKSIKRIYPPTESLLVQEEWKSGEVKK